MLAVMFEVFQRGGPVWYVYVIAFPVVIVAALFHPRIIFLAFWAVFTLLHTIMDIGFGNDVALINNNTAQWGGLLLAGLTIHFISNERRRVAEVSQRRIRELEIMNEISRELSGELDLGNLLQKIVERAVRMLRVSLGEILLLEKETRELNVVAQYPFHANRLGLKIKPGEGAMGRVAATKKPLIINTYKSSSNALPHEVAEGVEAVMDVPLLKGEECIGVLGVSSRVKSHRFTTDDLSLLIVLASQATLAIRNAQLYQEVRHLAFTDGLTGINNRRRLFELAEKEYRRATRYGRPLSVMLMDIDHFKSINDQHGHVAGDAVLTWFANECSGIIRQKIDVIGRFGGEEFAVLYPETGLAPAIDAAARIRKRVSQTKVDLGNDAAIHITISMGIASLSNDREVTLDHLIERADKALYTAKQKRDCLAYWDIKEEKPYLVDET